MTDRVKIKLTVGKLVELAYSKNKGVTASLMRTRGKFKVKIDQDGKVTLSGQAGALTFQGDKALAKLGAKVKFASILFENADGQNIKYTASFTFYKFATISVSGAFDIEKMITSCSGLLCIAARALKNGPREHDAAIKKAMGL